MTSLVDLILQAKKFRPAHLAELITQASTAAFAGDLLPADKSLWGTFWQGDVIAPGYRLPAVELALLRASRLDGTWLPETEVSQFLADLHQAVADPQAGVWTRPVAGEPCAIFAAPPDGTPTGPGIPAPNWVTVVWYGAGTGQLHAGYRTALPALNFSGAIRQRPLQLSAGKNRSPLINPAHWLAEAATEARPGEAPSTTGRLDTAILQLRYQMLSSQEDVTE